jgi:hypothetical protein
MSTEHSHRLSTSSASCIPPTMSIDDIQILSISPVLSTSTSLNTNGSSSSSLSNPNNSTSSASNTTGSSSSSSSNTNNSSSLSSNSPSYSTERICYLLKHENYKYDIVDNKAPSAVASHWRFFGFPAKLNSETGGFERIMGFTSYRKCKKTFVYGPNSGTNNMKRHSCVKQLKPELYINLEL